MSETPAAHAFTDHSLRLKQIAEPQSEIVHFDEPLPLDCGTALAPFCIAYQTYGALNAEKSNLVVVCHALTGDQHVANLHPVTGKAGWWETMVGPGKPIDTDRYFVLCANVIGGCMGSTGPSSINPATGRPYGPDFPVITVRRHGAGAGATARSSRHRPGAVRARRLDGRHAGAGMGRDL